MRRLQLHGPFRRRLTRLHRWSGLALLAPLVIAASTGAVLAFRADIERALEPRLHIVTPGPRLAPVQTVIDRVEANFPEARVATVTLPATPRDTLVVYLTPRPGRAGQELIASDVFVDPYTATILGQRNRRLPLFSRANLIPILIRLHYSVLLGTTGVWLMGIAALTWLVTSMLGLALAWPTEWLRGVSWRPILSIRRSSGSHTLNYDLHRAAGVLLLPIWIVLAFTSVYLNFPGAVRSITAALTTVTAAPTRSASPPRDISPEVIRVITGAPSTTGATAATADDAIARALAQVPGATAFGITRDFSAQWYSVRLKTAGDINPTGNSRVYVDFATGGVVATRLVSAARGGDRFLFWQFPLHSGEAFGLAGRMAIVTIAIVLNALCGAGVYLWWRGWTNRRRQRRAHRSVGPVEDLRPEGLRLPQQPSTPTTS